MLLKVQTDDPETVAALLNEAGSKRPTSLAVKIEQESQRDGGLSILAIALTFGKDVVAGLVAAWLYDVLKGRVSKLLIDGRQVPIEPKSLEQAIAKQQSTPS
jgi:hypothetical protein